MFAFGPELRLSITYELSLCHRPDHDVRSLRCGGGSIRGGLAAHIDFPDIAQLRTEPKKSLKYPRDSKNPYFRACKLCL